MPLKKHYIDFQYGNGNQVTPDEMDRYETAYFLHPSVGTATVGTAAGTAGALAITLVNKNLDYPRNLNVIATGQVATVTVSGQDQFGGTVTEVFTTAGTVAGTMVFARIGTATLTKADGAGTIEIGPQVGTSSTGPLLGLPFKVGGTLDVITGTWVDADVSKALTINGAAPSLTVVPGVHAVRVEVAGGIVAADSFVVTGKSKWRAVNDSSATISNLRQ